MLGGQRRDEKLFPLGFIERHCGRLFEELFSVEGCFMSKLTFISCEGLDGRRDCLV